MQHNHQKRRRKVNTVAVGPSQEFQVEGLTHDARGVARLSGKVTFIEGALPDEKVIAQVIKPGKSFDIASLNQIIEVSPYRLTPLCPHYDLCGGCSFQHLAMEQQLAAKQTWLQGQLRKVIGELPIERLSAEDYGYRRRARVAFIYSEGKTIMGFRGKASNRIIDIDNCIVLTPALQQIFAKLKQRLLSDSLAANLGHIELLEDSRGVSVLFRLTAMISPELKAQWMQWADTFSFVIYWQDPAEKRVQVEESDLRFYDVDDLRLRYHPQDFIQVNEQMNSKMVALAMKWLAPSQDDVILDLFCGVGNFSLPLAKRAKQVVGVEVQASMVAAGRRNASENKLENLQFVAADLSQAVTNELTAMSVTKVLLDPPRAGAKAFLDTLIGIKPQQILYVSCDAATLARDAEYLVSKGFKVLRVTMMNMFPQTSHVETMMLLERLSQ
ncbi:MAG: 23S rRNA (uracil(1939)-C(5))-methyltransferase RlmD [Paraglaciecola sp.]|nr:23S rRNA (uracil(1939)-C(5))-methyltransferase RlmD [Paraglaciecola sp.]